MSAVAGWQATTRSCFPHRRRIAVTSGRTPSSGRQSQSFSAEFELTGNAQAGELTLYTPLGSTAAALSWSPQTARMRTNGEFHYFESLDALIRQAVGTEIPVVALFAWLAGDNMVIAGWSADLSHHANGRITARRTQPAPVAELRLVLD